MQISNAGILQVCAWVITVWINYKKNTIDAILIQWHVNELRGILKLLHKKFTETHEQSVQVCVQALLKECI